MAKKIAIGVNLQIIGYRVIGKLPHHKLYLMRLNKLFAIQEPFYVLGTSMLLQYALLMLTPIIGLMLNIPIGFWHFPFSMGLFFVANGIFQTKVNGLNKWQSIAMAGLSSALLFIAFAYASMYHETCFDAIWYHHDAVYLLAKGWNPVYENLLLCIAHYLQPLYLVVDSYSNCLKAIKFS